MENMSGMRTPPLLTKLEDAAVERPQRLAELGIDRDFRRSLEASRRRREEAKARAEARYDAAGYVARLALTLGAGTIAFASLVVIFAPH